MMATGASSLVFLSRSAAFSLKRGIQSHVQRAFPGRPSRRDWSSRDTGQRMSFNLDDSPRLYAWSPQNLDHTVPLTSSRISGDSKPSTSSIPPRSTFVDSSPDKRIYILGIGNLGRLFAASLAELPERPPITLVVHRKELLEEWASKPGILIERGGASRRHSGFDIEWWTDTEPSGGTSREVGDGHAMSNLVVATKTPGLVPQLDRLRRYLSERSTVVFIQNGMNKFWPPHGDEYNRTRYAPGHHPNWLSCVTAHGVTSLGSFHSRHASLASAAVGPVLLNPETGTRAQYLVDQLVAAPHLAGRRVAQHELWVLQLEKLVVNAVINPLTAILRCRNGDLFTDPTGSVAHVMATLIQEASLVLQALVMDPSNEPILAQEAIVESRPLEAVRAELVERFAVDSLTAMLHRVGEQVKDNTSSMLQDVRLGKQTEIREFNGWLVDMASFLGLPDTKGHRILVDLVERRASHSPVELAAYIT